MSSINPTDSSASLEQAQLLAKIQAQNVSSATSSTSTSAMANLNALYGSDGSNKASKTVDALASTLGIDSTTLVSELKSGNKEELAKILSQKMALTALDGINGADSSDSSDGSSATGTTGATDSSNGSTSNSDDLVKLQSLLNSLKGSGNIYDSKI